MAFLKGRARTRSAPFQKANAVPKRQSWAGGRWHTTSTTCARQRTRGDCRMHQPRNNGVVLADDPLWYKDAIIYELHVRAFADSNGDGIGDFPGLLQKLDYLQDLGVTCLWLLPFFPSPLRDDGYDIADYLNVHPSYGTIEDFQEFLAAAHQRGL